MGHEGVSGGYMDSVQYTVRRQASDVRWVPVIRRLGKVRTSGSLRTSVNLARVEKYRTSGGVRSSGGLGVVGRPVLVGRPAAVACVGLVSLGWRDLQGPDVRAGPVVRWL